MKLSELKAKIAEMENLLEQVKQVRGLNREKVLFDDDIEVIGEDGESEWDIDVNLAYENDEGVTWLDKRKLAKVLLKQLDPGWKARIYVQIGLQAEASLPDIIPDDL